MVMYSRSSSSGEPPIKNSRACSSSVPSGRHVWTEMSCGPSSCVVCVLVKGSVFDLQICLRMVRDRTLPWSAGSRMYP